MRAAMRNENGSPGRIMVQTDVTCSRIKEMRSLMDAGQLQSYINWDIRLSDDDIALLLSASARTLLKKGELLVKEGDKCRSFFLVEHGYLRTWYNKDGVAINIDFTLEGTFTANFSSLRQNRQPSSLNIEAGEDTSVWEFNLDRLSDHFAAETRVSVFIRRLALRLMQASEQHSHLFRIYTPAERYYYVEQHRPELVQRIPLSQLASYLGVSRETLSRIRSKKARR